MLLDTPKRRCLSVPADIDDDSLDGFFEELRSALAEQPAEIDLDCSLLEHTTSRHINAIWDALTCCERVGVPMRLTSVGYGMQRVLEVLDLADLFSVEYEVGRRGKPARPPAVAGTARRLEIEMEAKIDAVVPAMQEIHGFLDQSGISDLGVFDLETVFYEVATNICQHSGLGGHRKIRFLAEIKEGEVTFEFTDPGDRFDPTGNTPEFDPRLAARRRQSRGLGLVIIQRLMDVVSYKRVDGRLNVVTLSKRLSQGAEAGK
jgi:anti-sigma regulatory factor (Ser/Thr protein kinase)/anti-anti-sigma regulatory factor